MTEIVIPLSHTCFRCKLNTVGEEIQLVQILRISMFWPPLKGVWLHVLIQKVMVILHHSDQGITALFELLKIGLAALSVDICAYHWRSAASPHNMILSGFTSDVVQEILERKCLCRIFIRTLNCSGTFLICHCKDVIILRGYDYLSDRIHLLQLTDFVDKEVGFTKLQRIFAWQTIAHAFCRDNCSNFLAHKLLSYYSLFLKKSRFWRNSSSLIFHHCICSNDAIFSSSKRYLMIFAGTPTTTA